MEKTVVAIKRSKWERDLNRFGSADEVRRLYTIQNHQFDKIYSAHERQKEALETLRAAFPGASFEHRENIPGLKFDDVERVISFGGDNHFVYVSSFIPRGVPIIGINSDPDTSLGALLYFSVREFIDLVTPGMASLKYETEDWSRIDCRLFYPDGKTLQTVPCTSEIGLQSAFSFHTSRYLIRTKGEAWEEQKSSGIILATGAGSTGWYRNCHWSQDQDNSVFPKDAPFFRLIARELLATKKYRFQYTTVNKGQSLEIISEMDGQICIDSHQESTYDFPPGCRAEFSLSGNPLRVVRALTRASSI